MRLTKYVHSCVLVEHDDTVVLIDPGKFSWDSRLFSVQDLAQLDVVVITHEHFDHFSEAFVLALLQKFPDVQFVSTLPVIARLKELGAKNVTNDSIPGIQIFSTKLHASLEPLGQAPENIAVHVHNKITFGGDRHDLEESKDILALTVTAPWGSMMSAAKMALDLKPQKVVPIHDWHWNEQAREGAYQSLHSFFQKHDIEFMQPVDGEVFEV